MKPGKLGIIVGGGPAPGINTAARTAVRLGIDRGHTILGVRNGIRGLLAGDVVEIETARLLGEFELFAADLAHPVLVETGERRLVLSPDDPEGFLRALAEPPTGP